MKKFGTALILAGGKSTRMGFDKQLLRINEVKLIDNAISILKEEFNEIIISSNTPELYADASYKVVKDIIKEKGPLGGIHAGLTASSSKYVYVTACDMPYINLEYIRFMKSNIINSKGCITKYKDSIEPFNGFYSVELIREIEIYLGENKKSVRGLLQNADITYIEEDEAKKYGANWDMFSNLNTTDDIYEYLSKDIKL